MAIVAADKIFVDVNDEINFVVEKFLEAGSGEVILVCPQNALILSSQVSIKILVKQMLKSKKLLVIVTEDDFGARIAESAGLVVTEKVSQISTNVWSQAVELKRNLQDELDLRKKTLLQERGIIESDTVEEEIVVPEPEVEVEIDMNEPVEEGESEETDEIESNPAQETETVVESDGKKPTDLVGAIQRKRPVAKVTSIGNLQIMGGGDISKITEENEDMAKKNATRLEAAEPTSQFKGGFTGRDWTKYTSKERKSILGRLSDAMPSFGSPDGVRSMSVAEDAAKKQRIMLFGGITILLLFAALVYLILFVFSSVDISVTLVKTEIPVEQKINIDANLSETDNTTIDDPSELTIAAIVVKEEQLSVSQTGDATGTSRRGDNAAGLVQIWNKTDEEITVKKGTVVTAIKNNRNYVIGEDAQVPAASGDATDGVDAWGVVEDIRIDAAKIGEEFNIVADETLDFTIKGYSSDEILVKGFNDIEGGTAEEFVSVSKKDIDGLTKTLKAQLISEGLERLEANIPTGYRLIEGTELFEQSELTADPDQGQEAETFVLSMEGKLTALAVREDDLNAAIQILILNSQDTAQEFDVTGLEDAVITEVKRENKKASFLITSQGSLQSALTVEDLRAELAGKSVVAARSYLDQQEDIESFRVIYSPGFVPQSFQQIPNDENRASIRIN